VTAPPPQLDPAEQKVRQIFGADSKAAAEAILATNNRASQMASKLREMGIDPRTMQPLVTAPPTVEPPPPAAVDPNVIENDARQMLRSDPTFESYVQAWSLNDQRLGEIGAAKGQLSDSVKQAELALKIPEVLADDFKADKYKEDLRSARTELLNLKLEESILRGEQVRINDLAGKMVQQARQAVYQQHEGRLNEQREKVELSRLESEYYAEYATAWPLAIENAVKNHKVPAELVEDFKDEAKAAALAYLQQNDGALEDLHAFADERARVLMDRLDRFHRMQSATYGAQAAARTAAATATPASPPPSSPTPQTTTPQAPRSLNSYERELEAEAALVARQMGLF
jgi:hypothetical protein